MTTRPNHPLPRQDLHLQACQRPKAAHRRMLFREHIVTLLGVVASMAERQRGGLMGGFPAASPARFGSPAKGSNQNVN
jgi:hypothetical protein